MGVLYGSYDDGLESKVQEIIDGENQENGTYPGQINNKYDEFIWKFSIIFQKTMSTTGTMLISDRLE